MKFNLLKANSFNNKEIKNRVIIGVTSIFLAGSITVGIVFGITGCNKKQPDPSNTSTSIVTSDPNEDSTQVPTNSNASGNSTETPSNSNNPNTSTSNPTDSSKSSNTPSSKSSTSTPSSKPSSSTPSSSTPSQPPVDGYFDPRNATQVNAIVDELSSQFTAAGKNDSSNKAVLKQLIQFANGVKVPENERNENESVDCVLRDATTLNGTDVAKRIFDLNGIESKKSVSIEKVFANKKDRALVEFFNKERNAIVDAALQGKSVDELKIMIENAYNKINQVAYNGGKVSTSMGNLGYNDIGNVAKYFLLLHSERITVFIMDIEDKYNVDYNSYETSGKYYSKQGDLLQKIRDDNNVLKTVSYSKKTSEYEETTLYYEQKKKILIRI
jgi:hypothetical protein